MSIKPPEEIPEEPEDWIVTYADAITLLLAFFVILVSFSKVNIPQFEAVQAGIKDQLGGAVDSERPIFSLMSQMQMVMQEQQQVDPSNVDVGYDDQGIIMEFASGNLFEPGSVELTPQAKQILMRIKQELEVPPFDIFLIAVEGHTDDTPISSPYYPSNWELSSARAARVVRYFQELGFDPAWLKASGYADTRPLFPNRGLDGAPIPENQARNRRITIRLHP
ncbi:MAG: flagellar motor protein MotB [Alphaproteobacteria bacterium]